jgi:hypothetical protein
MVLAGRDNNRIPRIVKLELPHVIREIGNGGADADLRRRGGVQVGCRVKFERRINISF